jgi:hypothetical protein
MVAWVRTRGALVALCGMVWRCMWNYCLASDWTAETTQFVHRSVRRQVAACDDLEACF